jgi:tRNA pseudouridine55 synthase
MDGLLLVNKPRGPTSFQIIKLLRRITGVKKIGHTGTLDPFARGLLLVVFGKATKFVQVLQNLEKEYIAKVLFGVSTETDDQEGEVLQEREIEPFEERELLDMLKNFQGRITQVPPRFSAVKHRGERAYKRARRGEDFQLEGRDVYISRIRMVYYNHPYLKVIVRCSKGTYIRAFARDFGKSMGTCASLFSLIRRSIGRWNISDSFTIDSSTERGIVEERLIPLSHLSKEQSEVYTSGLDVKKVCSV